MHTKENFKEFVKKHPELIKHVKDGKMTWQGFYEIYDMYGEDENAWKDFLTVAAATTASSFDIMNFIKNLDLDGVQEGINSIQRVLGLLQDMSPNTNTPNTRVRRPRPLYRHFDDWK